MAEKKKKSSAASASPASDSSLMNLVWFGAVAYALFLFLINAYVIRMQAIQEYGPVIHEFDPYFNWRATQVCVMLLEKLGHAYIDANAITSYCIYLTHPLFTTVPLRKRIQKVLLLVRSHGMVSPRSSSRNNNLPRDAVHSRISQRLRVRRKHDPQ